MGNTEPARIEGTPEQLAVRLRQLPSGKRYRLVEITENVVPQGKKTRVSAMGKYAGILSSEEFMRLKHDEIALEDREL